MGQIAIDIPEEVLYDTKMNSDEASAFVRRMVAVGYYTQNKVSLGYCAQIAGMSKEDFMKYLGKHGISIFQFDNREELLEEIDNA